MRKKIIYVKEAPRMVTSFYAPITQELQAGRELVIQALTGWYCFKIVERGYDQGNGWCCVFLKEIDSRAMPGFLCS